MLAYYTQQSLMSNPGRYADAFDDLPATVADLVRVVQGVTMHVFWSERYGLKLSPERQAEVQLRTLEKRLARTLELDPRPLAEARPPEQRLVGNCRDFSLLLVALLRHQGIPARARCGFGAYFLPNHFEDHWVAEYWNAAQQRWVLVDAQLDALQCEALHIAFDPLDTPRDQFIVGGQAWRMCRSGQANPDHFGIFDMHGLWFVRGDFVRDVAALNKMELLPWDDWGLINGDDAALTDYDWALLDRLADLTCGDAPELDTIRHLYATEPGLRVGDEIQSYIDGRAESVRLTL